MIANIIWGLFGIAIAVIIILYRRYIIEFTGTWGWAESYLGVGGSYSACVLIGIFIFLLSLTKMIGKLDAMIGGTLGQFFS